MEGGQLRQGDGLALSEMKTCFNEHSAYRHISILSRNDNGPETVLSSLMVLLLLDQSVALLLVNHEDLN